MKGMMPSPFDFEMVLSSVTDYFSGKNCFPTDNSFCEPISVLDSRIPTYSSTPSSSRGGGSAASTDRNASPIWQHDSTTATSSIAGGVDSVLLPVPPSLADNCALEDWESVLSESAAASPSQQHPNFRWIMGDVEDPAAIPTLNNKFLQFGAPEFDFHAGFGVMDQVFAGAKFSPNFSNRSISDNIDTAANHPIKFHHNPMHPSSVATNLGAALHFPAEMKPSVVVNVPFSYAHEQPAKKLNSGSGQIPKWPCGDARQQLNQQHQLQFLPNHLHHRPKTSCGDDLQQAIIAELHTAAELLQAGNPAPAQGILARLNQHLSPSGKPFRRAAFYCKEALQLLLRSPNPNAAAHSSPSSLLLKIGAYKSFSEISPLINFANFTCNQAILEAVQEFNRIHIVDFDIGYGGQWASLMQELASRKNGAPLLRITALVSPSTHDQLELILTRENLIQFADEISIGLEFEIIAVDSLSAGPWPVFSDEAVAVNIPVSFLSNPHLPATSALGLVKQLSPRIVVSVERGCDRADLPVVEHVIHAVGAYSSLLESLDAVIANADGAQKMERLLIQPEMEKVVMRRFRNREKWQHWRSLFLNCGFSPLAFSNFAESQAELVVKKTTVAGFEVEKKQSSLVLCWRGKELLSVSVWR